MLSGGASVRPLPHFLSCAVFPGGFSRGAEEEEGSLPQAAVGGLTGLSLGSFTSDLPRIPRALAQSRIPL